MPQLALVCPSFRNPPSPATKWAHDIRNTLATVGLHLDTLERLASSGGQKAVEAAHALMTRASSMCEQALTQSARAEPQARREVDVVKTIRQVAALLEPVAPARFEIRVHAQGAFPALADAEQLFRIIFNLLHNAVGVARRRSSLKTVDISVERAGATVVVRIADDGPGLPAAVRKQLFRPDVSSIGGSLGLAIARELAEQNGGMIELAESAKGTTFVLEFPAATASREGPVTRSLGQRIVHR